MIKCAIFDLDGTLVDSMGYWEKAPISYAKNKGLELTKEMVVKFFSLSLVESAKYLKEKFNLPSTVEEICHGIDKEMENAYENYVLMKPNMKLLLDEYDKANVKMGIATATDKYLVEKVLKRLGIDKYFSIIVTCGEVGKNKTHTDVYDKARNYLGFKENETIIFEDLPYGIISCKKAGYHTFGLYDEPSKMHWETIKQNAEYYTLKLQKEDIDLLISLTK